MKAERRPPAVLGQAAHPLRWQLLTELASSDQRVQELCATVGRPQSLVSYHLRHLRESGLVSARPSSADRRDSYHHVHLERYAELLAGAGSALHPAVRLGLAPGTPSISSSARPALVLFLCTGNSARSQMAEAMLEAAAGPLAAARSAGSHPKPMHPNTVRTMRERGLDLSSRRSKHLSEFLGDHFDLVVTLCDRVREVCPEFRGQPRHVHWSIPDPSAGDLDAEASYAAFQRAADEIALRVDFLVPSLPTLVHDMEVN